ncbi:unnamed protein product [Lathyrus oleraceus]
MSYNIQTSFNIGDYFSIKVTPLGANLCLLEESESIEIRDLIREAKSLQSQWFLEIREWREEDVDKEIVTWLRYYENTLKGQCMDVARFLVRTN